MLRRKKIKIAIVEDNVYFNKSLVKYIETICNPSIYLQYEFHIQSFTTANEAIQELDDELDFILLDYFLIDNDSDDYLNGMDVLAAVTKHCNHCKVILMSEYLDRLDPVELKEKGVHEFVDKKLNSNNRLGALIQFSLEHQYRA